MFLCVWFDGFMIVRESGGGWIEIYVAKTERDIYMYVFEMVVNVGVV